MTKIFDYNMIFISVVFAYQDLLNATSFDDILAVNYVSSDGQKMPYMFGRLKVNGVTFKGSNSAIFASILTSTLYGKN